MKFVKYFFITLIFIIFAAVTVAGYFTLEFFWKKPSSNAKIVVFNITKGDGVKRISAALKDAGIIKSTFGFETYVWLVGLDGVFQPGEYGLRAGENISSLVRELTTVSTKENQFTLIEGWDLIDIAKYLQEKKLIKNDDEFYYLTGRPGVDYRKEKVDFKGGWNYEFLSDKPAYANLEGFIYPDTYRILAEGNVESLIKKALNNFDKKLTSDLREEIGRQKKTIFEVVTMASVVEKEIGSYEDRRIVADIFWRRLKMGMALQADSTVNYITQSGRARSTYADLKTDSPWNTYKYSGLPLGPICNPSIEAIKATIYPQKNDYLFFLTDKNGVTHYAKTNAEHNINRAKYLK
ncbi:MAG: endolytic transglycosylase MltG [Patescibacteria group bacterium]